MDTTPPTQVMTHFSGRFSVAPMMQCTDRHYRYLARLFSTRTQLYTEMITTGALIHGDAAFHLRYNEEERPVVLQLGGSDPDALAQSARMGEAYGYDEINLNVGCPSGRVQKGGIGACLMLQPELVGRCVAAMKAAVKCPVTVKCRIGVDEQDSYDALQHFTRCVEEAGSDALIVHARKAWLQGLSPRENREIPPLHYDVVYQLKQDFPNLPIAINGGIKTLAEAKQHLSHVDGVMMGRAAYSHPELLREVDTILFDDTHTRPNTVRCVSQYLDYMEGQLKLGVPMRLMTRHLVHLFGGRPGSRQWRRLLSTHTVQLSLADIRSALEMRID